MSEGSRQKAPILRVPSFDLVYERFGAESLTFTEEDALKYSHWDMGEDARLREDARFCQTPWGRWMLSSRFLANDWIFAGFQERSISMKPLAEALQEVEQATGFKCVFCPKDPRFVLQGEFVRFAAYQLSDDPLIEIAEKPAKYVTHLPLYTLDAVAASLPSGEWGTEASQKQIEELGWIRVSIPGTTLNDRMFLARIRGSSMDDGRSGIVDGALAIFEWWPKGSRQNQEVLVRGAFRDPETGSFAIKRYVADTRDTERLHHRIRLVSLNPDKQKYPDILLEPQSESEVSVIARLKGVLSSDQFGRAPKKPKQAGKRDLVSPDGRNEVEERLRLAAQRIFGSPPEELPESAEVPRQEWKAQLICLDFESGGLNIETSPLNGLPSLVKKLAVRCGNREWMVLSSNMRNKVWRTQVLPESEPYTWTAPGHEELLHQDLGQIRLDGLLKTNVAIFRIDTGNVGRRVMGNTVSPGQSYRFLLPPNLTSVEIPERDVWKIEGGWRLWELQVPEKPDSGIRELLKKIGLDTGEATVLTDWVVVAPVAYRESWNGIIYPCFETAVPPIINIHGASTLVDGEISLFLFGETGLQRQPLPAGNSWNLRFNGLAPGQYVAEVLHRSTRFDPARLPFEITAIAPLPVSTQVSLTLGAQTLSPAQSGLITHEADLTNLGKDGLSFNLTLPPLWPVDLSWEMETAKPLGASNAGRNGEFDSQIIIERSLEYRIRNRIGNLIFDCDDLGRICLQHNRKPSIVDLQDQLLRLFAEKGELIQSLQGQFPLMRNLWLDQLLQMLGYEVSDQIPIPAESTLPGLIAILLHQTSRKRGKVKRVKSRILLLADPSLDLSAIDEGSVHYVADKLCEHQEVEKAVISDGIRWTLHEYGRQLHSHLWDLRHVLGTDGSHDDFEHFLYDIAVVV
jgi:hypothetical protein